MPNPILRAGPFASFTENFLDEPETRVATIVPVNCATNDWVNDSWKAGVTVLTESGGVSDPNGEDREDYEGTLPDSLSYDITGPGNQVGRIEFAFRYQAAVDFDIHIEAEANADPTGRFASTGIVVSVDGTRVVDEEDIGFGVRSVSYDDDITIPASVTPALFVIIITTSTSVTGPIDSSADASLEISVPT